MTSRLVLITGVNGFVGTHTALHFLNHGWRVRGAVRTEAKRLALQSNRVLKPFFEAGSCECIVFPRHDDVNGWKTAVRGVQGIAHIAVPTGGGHPDYAGVKNEVYSSISAMMTASAQESSIRAIALVSTGFTVCDLQPIIPTGMDAWWQSLAGRRFDETTRLAVDDEIAAKVDVRSSPLAGLVWYSAAQVGASELAARLAREQGGDVAVSSIILDTQIGAPLHLSSAAEVEHGGGSSLSLLKALLAGQNAKLPPSISCGRCDVRDAAQAFFQAIDRKAQGKFCITGVTAGNYESAIQLRKSRPDLAHMIPEVDLRESPLNQGYMVIDNSKSKRELGVEYHSLEDTLSAAVKYLEDVGYLK